jgi:hypothetical protein
MDDNDGRVIYRLAVKYRSNPGEIMKETEHAIFDSQPWINLAQHRGVLMENLCGFTILFWVFTLWNVPRFRVYHITGSIFVIWYTNEPLMHQRGQTRRREGGRCSMEVYEWLSPTWAMAPQVLCRCPRPLQHKEGSTLFQCLVCQKGLGNRGDILE